MHRWICYCQFIHFFCKSGDSGVSRVFLYLNHAYGLGSTISVYAWVGREWPQSEFELGLVFVAVGCVLREVWVSNGIGCQVRHNQCLPRFKATALLPALCCRSSFHGFHGSRALGWIITGRRVCSESEWEQVNEHGALSGRRALIHLALNLRLQ